MGGATQCKGLFLLGCQQAMHVLLSFCNTWATSLNIPTVPTIIWRHKQDIIIPPIIFYLRILRRTIYNLTQKYLSLEPADQTSPAPIWLSNALRIITSTLFKPVTASPQNNDPKLNILIFVIHRQDLRKPVLGCGAAVELLKF